MSRFSRLFKKPRIVILILIFIFSLIAVRPNPWNEGASVRGIVPNSSAHIAGIPLPLPNMHPMAREKIVAVNSQPVVAAADYFAAVKGVKPNELVLIETDSAVYRLYAKPVVEEIVSNETEQVVVPVVTQQNRTINGSIVPINVTTNQTVTRPKIIRNIIGTEDLGIRVFDAPSSNLRKGLDLQGGTRVLLEPEDDLSPEDLDSLIANMQERLNVYGLSDLVIKPAADLLGNRFILVEIPGASEEDVKNLLSRQGKFEAKIGADTVFQGGNDITYVCRSATCAGIDPQRGCSSAGGEWGCSFRFSISLSQEAAQRQANLTKNLAIVGQGGSAYLSEQLTLILDDQQVDSLNIGADLKGRPITDISISGGGSGPTRQDAEFSALSNMKRLQTILITGSLPTKITVIKSDTISPSLGEQFIANAIFIGIIVVMTVGVVVYARYRKLQIVVPMAIVIISEVIILLGVAALIGWNLDLSAIAGIIIATGTGIDNQIVMTDEIIAGEREQRTRSWRERIKNAVLIIMMSYFTTIVALVPLLFAGAGLLKGFALTTLIGASIGVFITRRAYGDIVEILLNDE